MYPDDVLPDTFITKHKTKEDGTTEKSGNSEKNKMGQRKQKKRETNRIRNALEPPNSCLTLLRYYFNYLYKDFWSFYV